MILLKKHKRANRRFHRKRLLKKRKDYWGWNISYDEPISPIVINTPTPCSCHMCGNARKYYKEKTKQELVWHQKTDDELKMYFSNC